MNKILVLKGVITVITLLIFLCLIGIAYGVANYKKTPKLISDKIAVKTDFFKSEPRETHLNQGTGAAIAAVTACGDYLCARVTQPFGADKIAVISPESGRVINWIHVGSAKTPEKK